MRPIGIFITLALGAVFTMLGWVVCARCIEQGASNLLMLVVGWIWFLFVVWITTQVAMCVEDKE